MEGQRVTDTYDASTDASFRRISLILRSSGLTGAVLSEDTLGLDAAVAEVPSVTVIWTEEMPGSVSDTSIFTRFSQFSLGCGSQTSCLCLIFTHIQETAMGNEEHRQVMDAHEKKRMWNDRMGKTKFTDVILTS